MLRWNFRPFQLIYNDCVFLKVLSLHIYPSMIHYFLSLFSVAWQTFSLFCPFFYIFPPGQGGDKNFTHAHVYTHQTYGIKPLQFHTGTLSFLRTFGRTHFNYRVLIFYPIFMRDQSPNMCLDKNWNFGIIKQKHILL